jgi:hypothetical protein
MIGPSAWCVLFDDTSTHHLRHLSEREQIESVMVCQLDISWFPQTKPNSSLPEVRTIHDEYAGPSNGQSETDFAVENRFEGCTPVPSPRGRGRKGRGLPVPRSAILLDRIERPVEWMRKDGYIL